MPVHQFAQSSHQFRQHAERQRTRDAGTQIALPFLDHEVRLVHELDGEDLRAEFGALAAADPTLAIQTHIAENDAEIAFTKALFPPETLPLQPDGCPHTHTTYAGVYDAFGLLRANTVLAHAVHLQPEEVALIKARGAGVSHCPTSNFNLRSGCAQVGMLLDHGIKVRRARRRVRFS